MLRMSNLSAIISVLAHSIFSQNSKVPSGQREDVLQKANRAATRRYERSYGMTSKYKPHVGFGQAQQRYAARIAAGNIQRSEILSNPVWATK